MRKTELQDLQNRLITLKLQITKILHQSSDNINDLIETDLSEEADIGSAVSIMHIDENSVIKYTKELKFINIALEKIERNKYGKCEMCSKAIDVRRLKVKPHARFCISCREIYEKQTNRSK